MKNRILSMFLLAALAPAALAARPAPVGRAKEIKTAKEFKAAKIAKGVSATYLTEAAPSRELNFDGASVKGRYHSAGEAVARVEGEKAMNMLIGARRDFRDRLAIERERLEKNETK